MATVPGEVRGAACLHSRDALRSASHRSRWRHVVVSIAVAIGAPALQAATAFVEGDAIYLERILPPPNARLIVSLQDTSRADAPAIEKASVSIINVAFGCRARRALSPRVERVGLGQR